MFHELLSRMGGFTKAPPEPDSVAPLDVIFSCCVCTAAFSEVYEGHTETVHGLSDGVNPKDRIVTRLWLASCCHVFCSKHLEGGAPPFHPAGTRPRAPCPVCSKEGELYSIRGFKPGEYDKAIPACWFVTPPIKLDSNGQEMEALRFQYMSLIAYTKQVTSDNRRVKVEIAEAQHELKKMQTLASEEHAKAISLEQEVEQLRGIERELQRFKKRMPAIEHYLKVIPKLTEQNEQMRQRLASLGFLMPLEPIQDYRQTSPTQSQHNSIAKGAVQSIPIIISASNLTNSTSADTLVNSQPTMKSPQSRPLKRQRVDSSRTEASIHAPERTSDSGHQMPPPRKTLSRIKSIKKIWPTMKNKLSSNGHFSPTMNERSTPISTMEVKDSLQGERIIQHASISTSPERLLTHYGDGRNVTRHVTGKTTVGSPCFTNLPQLQEMTHVDIDERVPEFSFRSAPQTNSVHRDPLPNPPSYIRLMDRLSRDTGLELGLRDPRQNFLDPHQAHSGNGQGLNADHMSATTRQSEGQKRWSLGHAFLHQSPNGQPSSNYQHPDPLRSNPMEQTNRDANSEAFNPVTPAPARFQQPAQQAESVVSPFFESRNSNPQFCSRGRVAERAVSSLRRSSNYQSPWRRMPSVEPPDWHEPRGLNGLSFFNSPLNIRNEPIRRHEESIDSNPFMRPDRPYPRRNLNSRGFIKRPDPKHPVFLPSSSRIPLNQPGYVQYPIALNSPGLSSFSRAVPLPSPVPSIASNQKVIRSASNWGKLVDPGIQRSSHKSKTRIPGNIPISPTRNVFSSAGRRSVRR